MKSFTHLFSLTALALMCLCLLGLGCQQAKAAPAACTITLPDGYSYSFTGNGGSFGIHVKASEANCPWTAKSNSVWMKITEGENHTGSKLLWVSVEHNNGVARDGSLNIAGHIYLVHQGANCEATLQRSFEDIGKQGGDVSVAVTLAALCNWEITTQVSWIKVKGNASFDGSGTAVFTVEANAGFARSGKLNIAGKDFTVNQAGFSCTYAVAPTAQNVPAGGGNYFSAVETDNVNAPCGWTAVSDSAWVKVTGVAGKIGSGSVTYTVMPNTGAARTANITLADKKITISQAAGPATWTPTLTVVNPGFAIANTQDSTLVLTLTGTNFTTTSQARWNNQPRFTTFFSATQLKFVVSSEDLKNAATNKVTVYDSTTETTSNSVNFLVLNPQASVSAASYKGEEIAPDSIVAAFGTKLADSIVVAKIVPLPTSLGGTTVRVIDSNNHERLAPLFFVSPGQVNYLMPAETAMGKATVVITSESGDLSVGYVSITKVSPGVFTATANGTGHPSALALRIKANGAQVYEAISRYDADTKKFLALPIDLTVPGEQVFIVLYATGLRNRSGLSTVTPMIGGTPIATAYAGPSSLAGLDQLNALLPASLAGRGEVDLVLSADGKTANTVKLTFK